MLVAIVAVVMLLLFLLNVPIYMSMFVACLIYFSFGDVNIMILVQKMLGGVQKTTLLAIPFFIMSGICMNYTGITRRMLKFCEKLTGHMPGGLAQVNVVLSTLMGGMSGSNIADAAMQSKILVPEMTEQGYDLGFSAAVTGSSSLITPVIPPGIAMISYALVANVSVGRLFMAGISAGTLMCVTQMITVHIISKKRGYKPMFPKRAPRRELAKAAREAIWALFMPVIIIGGIRSGIFTPTEAGAISVMYALVVGIVAYREFKFKHLIAALQETAVSTLSIGLIFASAASFGYIVSAEQLSIKFSNWMASIVHEPWQYMVVVVIALIVIGMFMEGGPVTIILIPLIAPIAQDMGIDLIHFGIVYVLVMALGQLTPPVGTVMFTVCNITKCEMKEYVKASLPFYFGLVLDIIILIAFPNFTLWLPNLLY